MSKSLVQDGGKLKPIQSTKPIKSTEVRKIVGLSINNGSALSSSNQRSRHALNSIGGGSSNRSRLVIRDNASGTTEIISKTPSRLKMASIRKAKASLAEKFNASSPYKNSESSTIGLATPMGHVQS